MPIVGGKPAPVLPIFGRQGILLVRAFAAVIILDIIRITLVAGGVATIAGIFPAVAMKLLDFVGIYGTVLAPVGAIVFIHPQFPKKPGFTANYAEVTGSTMNVAVLLAWLIPVGVCLFDFFVTKLVWAPFMAVPAWLTCGALYLIFSKSLLRSPAAEAQPTSQS